MCVACVSDFLNIYWVSWSQIHHRPCFLLAPAMCSTRLRSSFAWAVIFLFDDMRRVGVRFFNISWVFLAPDTSPTLFFTGTCYTFNTLVVEFCLGRHLSVCLHASVLLSSGASYPPQSSEIWSVTGVGAPRFFLGVFLGPRLPFAWFSYRPGTS